MRRIVQLGLAAALSLALAAPAAGQAGRRADDPEGALVEELIVTARERGPAWWRVSDADTTVYILGVPGGPLPADMKWDRAVLERRMTGAHSVIMGTTLTAGLKDVPALLRARARLKSKAPMEATLPPTLRMRFAAARERLGKPAGRYAGWQPVVAGQFLLFDAYGGRPRVSVEDVARSLARKAKAPIRRSSRYDLVPFLNAAIAGLTPQIQEGCLDGALDDVEAGPQRARRAAEGWARGDTAAALTAPRNFDRCLLILSGGAALWRNSTRDSAGDIADALKTPGHAVAVVNLRRLLAEDGVIAALEARGLEVKGPGEP